MSIHKQQQKLQTPPHLPSSLYVLIQIHARIPMSPVAAVQSHGHKTWERVGIYAYLGSHTKTFPNTQRLNNNVPMIG